MTKPRKKSHKEFLHNAVGSPLCKVVYSDHLGDPTVTLVLAVEDMNDPIIKTVKERLEQKGFKHPYICSHYDEQLFGRSMLVGISVDIPDPTIQTTKKWTIDRDRPKVEKALEEILSLQFHRGAYEEFTPRHEKRNSFEDAKSKAAQKRLDNKGRGR